MSERQPVNVVAYIAATCAVSWALIGGGYALGLPWQGVNMMLLGCVLMWIPGLVALVMERKRVPGRVKEALGVGMAANRWWLLAWLGPTTLTLVTLGISLLLPGHELATDLKSIVDVLASELPADERQTVQDSLEDLPVPLFWLQLIQGLTVGGLVTMLFALGEEIGWRGFLDREASCRGWGFWKGSLAIGALWGLWHWPVIIQGHNYPDHPVLGVLLMVLFCMGLAPLFTFVTRMGGSVFAAALAHGTLNATAMLPHMVVGGGSDLTVGITSLSGLGLLVVVNLALVPLVRRYQERLDAFWAEAI